MFRKNNYEPDQYSQTHAVNSIDIKSIEKKNNEVNLMRFNNSVHNHMQFSKLI